MFSRKTVFVVGAGARDEVGLPVGSKLADRIARLFRFKFRSHTLEEGDTNFLTVLHRVFPNVEVRKAHMESGRQLANGINLVNSIDNYIDAHRHDARIEACGKVAIVYSILRAEAASSLFPATTPFGATIDFPQLDKSWFNQFGSMLVEGVSVETLDSMFDKVSFICFNYDRCLE